MNYKYKRFTFSLVLMATAAAAALGLVGCNNKQTDTTPATAPTAASAAAAENAKLMSGFTDVLAAYRKIIVLFADEKNAAALGLNFSSKLVYADVGRGVRKASQQLVDGKTVVVFERAQYAFVVSGASAGRSGSRRRYRSPASAPRRSCA